MDIERASRLYPMNPILKVCRDLKTRIDSIGRPHENTLETVGAYISIVTKNDEAKDVYVPKLSNMELEIGEYYGDKWLKRLEDETYHYKQIQYSLLHKVKELKYFFNAPLENRKTIVFSQDCISSVQYLKRENRSMLLVHMRSSDILELLPMDLLYLAKIHRRINQEYAPEVVIEVLEVSIGSAHYYTSGGRA